MIDHPDEGERDPSAAPWWFVALKVGLAMFIADGIARLLGFANPSVASISVIFIASEPPAKSLGRGMRRWSAAIGGVLVGAFGAAMIAAGGLLPSFALLMVGAIAGALRPRSIDYLYAAVIGAVVALDVQSSDDPVLRVAASKAALVTIGCIVAPLVVLAADRIWGIWSGRKAEDA